jgi:hypothetical protein
MSFHIGQKVVRIEVSGQVADEIHRRACDVTGARLTEIGEVYTIRTINDWPGRTLLTFHELDNSHMLARLGVTIEPGFDSRGFRAVVERKTDISIFIAMLTPQPAPTRAGALD